MLLTKEQIRAAKDRAFEDVEIPDWGGVVRLWVMSGKAREQFEATSRTFREGGKVPGCLRAQLLILCAGNAEGEMLFTQDDAEWLSEKNARILMLLFPVCLKMNGLDKEAEEANKVK